MAQALHTSLATGGLTQGGLRPGLGGDNIFVTSSLDLNFGMTKSLGDLVTFTRASSGTYVGSNGVLQTATTNEPRFDHNPTTGESLGLLVEEQRTNLLLRSEQFDDASWGKNSVTASANSIAAPDGASTADSIIETVANAEHGIQQNFSAVSGTAYTLSVFVKSLSGNRVVKLRFTTTAWTGAINTQADFNLTTGASTAVTGSPTMSSQAFPGGWWRFSMTATSTANGSPTANVQLVQSVSGPITYTGDGASGIYLWGAQLEAGSFPTSYIPTTTAAATRNADVASITGTNFSSWYRQDGGTVFADVNSAPVNNIAQLTFDISEGVGNERMFQRRNTSGIVATAVLDNGVTQGDIGSVVIGASARYKSGFAYKLNDLEIIVNGGGSATDTSATMPTPDRLHIGQNYASGQICNGTIRRLCYWPQRLSNQTLQTISGPALPAPAVSDPYFSSVSMLLHMNGSNGSTTFTDSSSNALTVQANGNAQISTAQSKFGGASGLFDGTGDYLLATSSGFSFGTGDFTVEGWMRVADTTGFKAIASFQSGNDNNTVYMNGATFTWWDGGGRANITGLSANVWYHFAVTRQSGTLRTFIDGVKAAFDYTSSADITSGNVRIGANGAATTEWFNGNLDDIRITKGVARYTANFTPPTAAFPDN